MQQSGLFAFILCVVYAPVKAESFPERSLKQPNIIFIFADDLGWNDVSFHGNGEIPTPNIDRLAAEGVILNSHYSQYLCTPSRAALMTGKYPMRFGLHNGVLGLGEPRGLDPNQTIMPQYLKTVGYSTHMIGKWHLGYHKESITPQIGMSPPSFTGFGLKDDGEPAYKYIGRYSTDIFTERAVKLIDEHKDDKPFFLYLSHMAPHFANPDDPVQAPQEYINRFMHIAHTGRRRYAGIHVRSVLGSILFRLCSPATVSALDDAIGTLFKALTDSEFANNTVVVFSSDNGAVGPERDAMGTGMSSFGSNWPLRGTKATQFEGGVRTAAFVWSRLLTNVSRVSRELYHLTDWLPTFNRLAGGEPIQGLDGHDIWESLSKGSTSPRTEVLLHVSALTNEYAMRWKQYKLHVNTTVNQGIKLDQWYPPVTGINDELFAPGPGVVSCGNTTNLAHTPCDANQSPCLFDVETDPCELNNIATLFPEVLDLMLEKLRTYNSTALPSNPLPLDPRAALKTQATGLICPWIDE